MNNEKVENKESAFDFSSRVFTKEFFSELEKHNKAILSAIKSCNKDIEKIAFNLYWIYQEKAYKAMGHVSIMDYAREYFDIEKSTTYNYISIVERFGARDKDGNLTLKGFGSDYKDYSYSKLLLLSSIQEDDINYLDINPDMSVRDIKKAIKNAISTGTISDPSLTSHNNSVSDYAKKPEPDLHQSISDINRLIASCNKDNELSVSNISESNLDDNDSSCELYTDLISSFPYEVIKTGEVSLVLQRSFESYLNDHPEIDSDRCYVEVKICYSTK